MLLESKLRSRGRQKRGQGKVRTIQSDRYVSKDLIVQYKNTRYQLLPPVGYRYTLRNTKRNTKIKVIENKNGRIFFEYKNKNISYTISVKTVKPCKPIKIVSSKDFKENRIRIPAFDHPWRQESRVRLENFNNL